MQGLQGKKVIAIATGSLHCVCCTEEGRWQPSASRELPSLCCGAMNTSPFTLHRELACVQAGPSLAQEQVWGGRGAHPACSSSPSPSSPPLRACVCRGGSA